MKLLKENAERKWYLVEEFVTKAGLPARIQQCVWNRDLMPTLSLHDHYTGYVRMPDGVKIDKDKAEGKFDVHGGVTFADEIEGITGFWIGFDMAHYNDENIPDPIVYARKECEFLAKQMAK